MHSDQALEPILTKLLTQFLGRQISVEFVHEQNHMFRFNGNHFKNDICLVRLMVFVNKNYFKETAQFKLFGLDVALQKQEDYR